MGFSIVVDSCCDLTQEMRADPVFRVIPLTIRVEGQDYVDDDQLDTSLLLRAMKESQGPSSSNCPAPGDYLDAFRAAEGDIYVVTLSALLSGSHNSARQGAALFREEQPERNIHIFNSCSASAGEVALALKIRELAGSGLDFREVVRQADQTIREGNTLFVLENLDNLRKNGRLNEMQALITGTLRIKLIMTGTPAGTIDKIGQALSVKQALSKLADAAADRAKKYGIKDRTLVISHCNCPDRAIYMRNLLFKKLPFDKVEIIRTGGISTVYAGDGGVVVAF